MDWENWHSEVLNFWFQELTPKDWFISTPEGDDLIKTRFKDLVLSLADELPEGTKLTADKSLAAILCFDQFTRNIFRGQAQAFAYDHLALSLSQHIIEQGWDKDMDDPHKQFTYMPLMHSEDLKVQKQSLVVFRVFSDEIFKYAQDHHDIIETYGRYPHRNACLGRQSTPEELEYLKDAQRFGQ